jgi:hypothetical protein
MRSIIRCKNCECFNKEDGKCYNFNLGDDSIFKPDSKNFSCIEHYQKLANENKGRVSEMYCAKVNRLKLLLL